MSRHLKVCHTSDWHLGHTFHGHSRAVEHGAFLRFLLEVLAEQEVDALIIAGDVFHTANPSASAQAMFYRFLADAGRRCPGLDVLITAGNHDSPARLGAADPILRALRVRVVGLVPRTGSGGRAAIDPDAMIVPLHDRGGETAAWVAAVPFLRPSDIPFQAARVEGARDLGEGVRAIYRDVLAEVHRRAKPDQAVIATGHCYMADVTPSESERAILGGGQRPLPVDIFDDPVTGDEVTGDEVAGDEVAGDEVAGDEVADNKVAGNNKVDYVALGHLHMAQAVGTREHIRYSGSPIPLSMSERSYAHQLRIVRFQGGRLVGQDEVLIPRSVDLLRVPDGDPEELSDVIARLERMELPGGSATSSSTSSSSTSSSSTSSSSTSSSSSLAEPPFLEVRVQLKEPLIDLRQRIEAAIGERRVRLVKITTEYAGAKASLAERAPSRQLGDLSVHEVFARAYEARYDDAPSPELRAAFAEVTDAARRTLERGTG